MPTLAWVEQEYVKALASANTPANLRDFALLCIARDHLRADAPPPRGEDEKEGKKNAVLLTAYSADLNTVPTLAQIEDGIGALAANTAEDRRRIEDAKTWAAIIGHK